MRRFFIGMTTLAAIAGVAVAQDYTPTGTAGQVNISGATLFGDFFKAAASGNDHIDVDGDGLAGYFDFAPYVDQLAETGSCVPSSHWTIHYRGVGSVNGLGEFVSFQLDSIVPDNAPSEFGTVNTMAYWDEGSTGSCSIQWPLFENGIQVGGAPIIPTGVDAAVLDVPIAWAVQGPAGTPNWSLRPGQAGYGANAVVSSTGYKNTLETLSRGTVSLNTDTANPDAFTVFDTPIAWVPIGIIGNSGIGDVDFTISELQYQFVTGRLPNGRNLVACTRDIGSGTRNGAMNSLGIDPSFGRGENLGDKIKTDNSGLIGPNFQPSNRGGSSLMEGAVQNCGLGIGYTGIIGGSRCAADAAAGKYEIMNVMFDICGGTTYVRPSLVNIVQNDSFDDGWFIGGPETFGTVGDPFAAVGDPYRNDEPIGDYLRNMVKSIIDFNGSPNANVNWHMPGEFLASNWTLLAGIDNLPAQPNNCFAPNAAFNQATQDYILTYNTLVVPAVGQATMKNPVREGGYSYNDGSPDGAYYNAHAGAYNIGSLKNPRNEVMGDFNNDGVCDLDDATELVVAVQAPLTWPLSAPGSTLSNPVVPHIIGDFNGDGNFDDIDVRYFADGLALDPTTNVLDREAGFTAIDNAFDGNYFGTVWSDGRTYQAGDSRYDVAGNMQTPGASPVGADGVIDQADFDYIAANYGDWTDLDQAAAMDLSCDMNGDLVVDCNDNPDDSCVIIGDTNCDGVTDVFDIDPFVAALVDAVGYATTYPDCDVMSADCNDDGVIDVFDIDPFVAILVGT